MKIEELIKEIAGVSVKGDPTTEITGICSNSKEVKPGSLFIAKRGKNSHGMDYSREAISAGAAAIVTTSYLPSLPVTQLICSHLLEVEILLTQIFYKTPSRHLFMVAITGTNGKTTTASIIKHLLGASTGLIGTVEYVTGARSIAASRTTPDLCQNQQLLAEMVDSGCSSAVMEVTSHALTQQRVAAIEFDVALFTNLTEEHLDYHKTMDCYCAAKQSLFTSLKTTTYKQPVAILNYDCMWYEKMASACSVPTITYGVKEGADIQAKEITLSSTSSQFTVCYKEQQVRITSPLPGRFNISNTLAALAAGLVKGLSLPFLADRLLSFKPVSGRLQPVMNRLGIHIYIDFAHTEDALENALCCLSEFTQGRVITVFGCGGDRDRSKRPKMACVSEKWSKITIVTSDNPRSESPRAICEEIARGFSPQAHFYIEVDRYRAIERAVSLAKAGDSILIAGKGHEEYQIFSDQTISFSDCEVAKRVCQMKRS